MYCNLVFHSPNNSFKLSAICFSKVAASFLKNDYLTRYADLSDHWNQGMESNELVDGEGNQVLGGSCIPVEKMNEKTTAFLKTIAVQRTSGPKDYPFKQRNERWYISSIVWDVKEEIASRYGVTIEIEQCSPYYRGTWPKGQKQREAAVTIELKGGK